MEVDLTLSPERAREVTDLAVSHVNSAIAELRRRFLVENFVDSFKFGLLLYVLTYLGAWFNGLTLIILGFVALFTLPKVYENNQAQIDANLELVRAKINEVTDKYVFKLNPKEFFSIFFLSESKQLSHWERSLRKTRTRTSKVFFFKDENIPGITILILKENALPTPN